MTSIPSKPKRSSNTISLENVQLTKLEGRGRCALHLHVLPSACAIHKLYSSNSLITVLVDGFNTNFKNKLMLVQVPSKATNQPHLDQQVYMLRTSSTRIKRRGRC